MSDARQSSASIVAIYRYPVKGLSPQSMTRAALKKNEAIAYDRAWAIENGTGRFDPSAQRYLPKTNFVMLMRHEALASVETHFDETTSTLDICRDGETVARGLLSTDEGRKAIEDFVSRLVGPSPQGQPRIVSSEGHSFSDVASKCLHVINLASLNALEHAAGREIDALRFRPNLIVDGWPAWREFDIVGKQLAVGDVRLKVFKRTMRCAATNVDPTCGARDMEIPNLLKNSWDHTDFGVYAKVIRGGEIAPGDDVTLVT